MLTSQPVVSLRACGMLLVNVLCFAAGTCFLCCLMCEHHVESNMQVMKCSIDADGVLSDQVSSEAISAAIRQQLNIDLAPQLISIPEPFTELGQCHAMLQMTLPDGSRPLLQIHLTEP